MGNQGSSLGLLIPKSRSFYHTHVFQLPSLFRGSTWRTKSMSTCSRQSGSAGFVLHIRFLRIVLFKEWALGLKKIEPSLTPRHVLKRTPPRWELGMNKSLRVRKERQVKPAGVERPWENPLGWGCRLCKDAGCWMCRRHQGVGASQGEKVRRAAVGERGWAWISRQD